MSSLPEYLKMYISNENKKYKKDSLNKSNNYEDKTIEELVEYKREINEGYSYYYSTIRILANPYIK